MARVRKEDQRLPTIKCQYQQVASRHLPYFCILDKLIIIASLHYNEIQCAVIERECITSPVIQVRSTCDFSHSPSILQFRMIRAFGKQLLVVQKYGREAEQTSNAVSQ
jgi:hypothetical protein